VKCTDFLKELSAYLDGAIDETLKSDLEEHLMWCSDCHIICDTTKQTIEVYRNNEIYPLPDDIRGRLHTAIIAKCRTKRCK
jgi:predicted anti-sigma-YlaC factor YlaD